MLAERPECRAERKILDSNASAMGQPPPATMWTLPDLCLIKIFEEFSLDQLYVAANVCERFRRIAVSAFRLKFNQHYLQDDSMELVVFVRCLRIFSPSGVRISVDHNGQIFRAIAAHCHDLEALSIKETITRPDALAVVRSLLPRLKRISVIQMDIWGGSDVGVDWQVEQLHLHHLERKPYLPMPLIKLPKLKKLSLAVDTEEYADGPPFCDFLAANGHIAELKLRVRKPMTRSHFRAIVNCVPNLRLLVLCGIQADIFEPDVDANFIGPSGGLLKRLDTVSLWLCSGLNFILSLLIDSPVRHLLIFLAGPEGKTVSGLNRFASVRRLSMYTFPDITVDHVLRYAHSMSGLKELCLGGSRSLDEIKRLVEGLRGIPKLRAQVFREVRDIVKFEETAAAIAARPKLCVAVEAYKVLRKILGCTDADSASNKYK